MRAMWLALAAAVAFSACGGDEAQGTTTVKRYAIDSH